MSALHSVPPRPVVDTTDQLLQARVVELERELEVLRQENAQLRRLNGRASPAPHAEPVLLGPAMPDLSPHHGQSTEAGLPYESLLTALGSVFPIGVFRIDHNGRVTHADKALERIFGLPTVSFSELGWTPLVHPQDAERVQQQWIEGLASGQSVSTEFRLVRPDGAVVHLLGRNVPQHDSTGRLLGHLGFVQDITSLRVLQADARIQEQLNRQIIASSSDCTKVLDLQGGVQQMTSQGCKLIELDDFEQVRGSDWTQWWPGESAEQARAVLHEARSGKNARFIAMCKTFKGTPKWWDTSVSPILGTDGQPVMLLAVSRDVTEQHHQQDEIRLLNAHLEGRVRERTEELADANARLSQSLREAQSLYNQAPCGYHSLDIHGGFVAINDTELRWLGYQREEVIGRLNFRDITLPSRIPMLEDRMERLVREGSLSSTEYEMRRKDGSMIVALLSSTAVRDAEGRFLHSNTSVVDITARKAAELALRENQRFLQAITDHVPGMIAYLDARLRFRFANAEHLRIYGMDPNKILGRHVRSCLPPEVWADIEPCIRAALNGQTQHFEAWRNTIKGNRVFISATYLPDLHAGRVQGVFVQIIDITERKRVEERVNQLNDELEVRMRERSLELLESEQRFRLMVDNLREYCIFFLDAQGFITDWTDSAQRMEGYSPTESLGRHYSMLFRQSDPEVALASATQMLRLAASRGQHELHSWHHRKDGSEYWSHSLLIALRDDSGELCGFAKINRDMTDAKRLDDLMRNINDELENRVADRTEQLLAANKDLESFSYSVSHDLRSPLRHISSFVSLLEEHLEGQLDETALKYLSTIGNSARHMSQLIDGLLAFSRLGRSAVNLTAVDFAMLVEAVVSQIAHDTDGRVVDWVIAPDLPVVQGDALLLREVWANLIGNAFKYSRPRERTVIEIGWSVDPAVGYTFYVRDNGVGFDTKYAEKLFGVFQRLHRASEFEGTGIGLALTRRILERHGGGIWAESQLGEGSIFHFSLPFEGCSPTDSSRDSIPSVLEP